VKSFGRDTWVILILAAISVGAALVLKLAGFDGVPVFVASAVGLAALAALVGEGTDQLGRRFGPGATGVLQSALGNLPEFFICIFALRAGLVAVVQAAIIGSILANTLLVLGLAFFLGGLKHGTQRFGAGRTRMMATMLVLAVAAMAMPTLATTVGPAFRHETELSVVVSVVLLVVFAASIPFSVSGGGPAAGAGISVETGRHWPMPLTLATLFGAAAAAAITSDWFVEALKPAMGSLGMSEEFAGLVVIAIAGNAVENVVGVRAMVADKGELAVSIILNSSLQVALALAPVLVLISLVLGEATLTLVVSPLLVAALALTAFLTALVVDDGKSTWLEGALLMGLYVIIAASVWWGHPIA
jgi:Ca2+:H+ antiporter